MIILILSRFMTRACHPIWYEVVTPVFICISAMTNDAPTFSYAYWPLCILFGEASVQVLCLFLKLGCLSFVVENIFKIIIVILLSKHLNIQVFKFGYRVVNILSS